MAVSHALSVLAYAEMPETDRPDERIWLDQEALQEHFERVREKYRSKADGDNSQDVPDPADMNENELLRGLRR